MTFDELRREYDMGELLEEDMSDDPFEQFQRWFDDAQRADIYLPDAMVLATADASGAPNVRTVVLRGADEHGLVFYTNYGSDKAAELDANPRAALHFHWATLERQVKIFGSVTRTPRADAEAYWAKRPRSGQVGAWASPQSSPLSGRRELDAAADEVESRFRGEPIPCPEGWGGYVLVPESFEFWQGRPNRLHDRLRYVLEDLVWRLERIAP